METVANANGYRVYGVACFIWRLVLMAIRAPILTTELMCHPVINSSKNICIDAKLHV